MTRKTIACALALAALAVAGPVAAAAQAPRATPAVLVLSVTGPDRPMRSGVLHCGPHGGTHNRPAEACSALEQVNGDPAALNMDPERACTMQYDPISVTVRGTWKGRAVDYRETFANPCVLVVTTGPVFDI